MRPTTATLKESWAPSLLVIRQFVSASSDGTLRVWDVAARREVRRVEVAPGAPPLRSLAPLPSVNAPPVASILKRDADEAPGDVPCALLRPRARVSEPASADAAAALRARADAARRTRGGGPPSPRRVGRGADGWMNNGQQPCSPTYEGAPDPELDDRWDLRWEGQYAAARERGDEWRSARILVAHDSGGLANVR